MRRREGPADAAFLALVARGCPVPRELFDACPELARELLTTFSAVIERLEYALFSRKTQIRELGETVPSDQRTHAKIHKL